MLNARVGCLGEVRSANVLCGSATAFVFLDRAFPQTFNLSQLAVACPFGQPLAFNASCSWPGAGAISAPTADSLAFNVSVQRLAPTHVRAVSGSILPFVHMRLETEFLTIASHELICGIETSSSRLQFPSLTSQYQNISFFGLSGRFVSNAAYPITCTVLCSLNGV